MWEIGDDLYRDSFVEEQWRLFLEEVDTEHRIIHNKGICLNTIHSLWRMELDEVDPFFRTYHERVLEFVEDANDHWFDVHEREIYEEELEEIFETTPKFLNVYVDICANHLKVKQKLILEFDEQDREVLKRSYDKHYVEGKKAVSRHNKSLFQRAINRIWKKYKRRSKLRI